MLSVVTIITRGATDSKTERLISIVQHYRSNKPGIKWTNWSHKRLGINV